MERIIKTNEEYKEALSEIEKLVLADPRVGSSQADQLELVSLLVENFENKSVSIPSMDPIEAIEFLMEQNNLIQRDLEPYIGNKSKVSEVLSRKRPLTLPMIRSLSEGLGIPASILLRASQINISIGQEADPTLYPIKEMIKRGWITAPTKGIKDSPTSIIREFFEPVGGVDYLANIMARTSKHIRSARQMNDYALKAWAARVIGLSKTVSAPAFNYDISLDPSVLKEISHLSILEDGPLLALHGLRNLGVIVIVEPHLPQTYLDGAAIMIRGSNPVIGLTVRYDRLDNFWFTLMHEIAHIVCHASTEITSFFDDLEIDSRQNQYEIEADDLAGEMLIPQLAWDESSVKILRSPPSAVLLANDLGIHPSIVAGRVRKEFNQYKHTGLNKLVGPGSIRKLFPQIQWPGK